MYIITLWKERIDTMSVTKVREYLETMGFEGEIIEFDIGTQTVDLAAAALGTEPARICKTMSFQMGRCVTASSRSAP